MSIPIAKEGVYFLYSKSELVYVGQSNSIFKRISEHIKDDTKEFDSFDYYETVDRFNLEGFLIRTLKPKYNIAGGMDKNFGWKGHMYTTSKIEEAIATYEKEPIAVKDVAYELDASDWDVMFVLNDHKDEVPAWKHDMGWMIDREWYKANKEKMRKWVNKRIDDRIMGAFIRAHENADDKSSIQR